MNFKQSSSELDLILPGLFWPDLGDIQQLYQETKTPNLDQLIKYSKTKPLNFSYSDIIYNLAFPHIDGSLAKHLTLTLNQTSPEPLARAIVEPTYLRVDRDRLLIAESELLQLDNGETDLIITYLNQNLEDGIKLSKLNAQLWLIEIDHLTNHYLNNKLSINSAHLPISTTPIIDIIGENIDDYLSTNHIIINKILNDIQMLLFNAPSNKIRQKHGKLIINSLWMWDKTLNHQISSTFNHNIYSNNLLLLESNSNIHKLASNFNQLLQQLNYSRSGKKYTMIFDSLYYPACYRDSYSWINKLELFDQSLFSQLLELFETKQLKQINLFVPTKQNTLQLHISKTKSWKFWYNSDLTTLAAKM